MHVQGFLVYMRGCCACLRMGPCGMVQTIRANFRTACAARSTRCAPCILVDRSFAFAFVAATGLFAKRFAGASWPRSCRFGRSNTHFFSQIRQTPRKSKRPTRGPEHFGNSAIGTLNVNVFSIQVEYRSAKMSARSNQIDQLLSAAGVGEEGTGETMQQRCHPSRVPFFPGRLAAAASTPHVRAARRRTASAVQVAGRVSTRNGHCGIHIYIYKMLCVDSHPDK